MTPRLHDGECADHQFKNNKPSELNNLDCVFYEEFLKGLKIHSREVDDYNFEIMKARFKNISQKNANLAPDEKINIKNAASTHKRVVQPKYRLPTGETWAGRGRRPLAFAAVLRAGHSIEEFLIDKPVAEEQPTEKKTRQT